MSWQDEAPRSERGTFFSSTYCWIPVGWIQKMLKIRSTYEERVDSGLPGATAVHAPQPAHQPTVLVADKAVRIRPAENS